MENLPEEKNNQDKENRSKHAALWCGLIFFFVLILCLWIFNAKNIFPRRDKTIKFNLETISQELKDSFKEVSEKIDGLAPISTSTDTNTNYETYEENQQKELFRK